MGFTFAAVEALFEQADFGFEFGDALLALLVASLPARVAVGLAVGQLFLEFGFAAQRALVKGLVETDLLAGVAEQLLAGGQAAGCRAGERVTEGSVIGLHEGSSPEVVATREVGSERREKEEEAERDGC